MQDTTTWYIDLLIVDHPNCRRSKDYYIYSFILSIKLAGIISWINALMIPIKIGWKGADFSGFFFLPNDKFPYQLPSLSTKLRSSFSVEKGGGGGSTIPDAISRCGDCLMKKCLGRSWILVEDAQYLLKLDEISMRSTSVVENDAQIASWLDSGSTQGGAPPCTVLVGLPTFHC